MLDYLNYLTETEDWEPFKIPELDDPIWFTKFDAATLAGKRNIAHAWLWEFNLEITKKHYNRPCPGLISMFGDNATQILTFGRYCSADKTKKWFFKGSAKSVSDVICYKEKYSGLDKALDLIWSLDTDAQIEGICSLEDFHYDSFAKVPTAFDQICKILHDFTWLILSETNSRNPLARYVGCLFIAKLEHKYTFEGKAFSHQNDPVALVWHQFVHFGFERDLFTKEGELKLRNDILERPLRERFEVMVHLARDWLHGNSLKSVNDLDTLIDYDESIYNWFAIDKTTVYDLMGQWLPELVPALKAAHATGIQLHELRSYLFSIDSHITATDLPDVNYVV